MPSTNTIIIGAGQAGLAASRLLVEAQREHVVLERGRVGERWLSSTWDSLRLLTPNWMTRLPHWGYSGPEPDGYMTAREVAAFLGAYRRSFAAPVEQKTSVERVGARDDGDGDGFVVATNRETWRAKNVILATGWTDRPAIPPLAARLAASIEQVTPAAYRNPGGLPEGGVLVVGASATGVQLADELRRDGRRVYLAGGRHTRMRRRYRGRDIFWWLDQTGALDRRIQDVRSAADAPREPSMQLIGRPDSAEVDLPTLAASGVRLVGRLTALDGTVAHFADDLHATMRAAEERLCRTLARIDRHILALDLPEQAIAPARLTPPAPIYPTCRIDLRQAGISSVVWATGHRRDYRWLDLPVLDARGELVHSGGITPIPGLYALGLRFQRRRRSNFLDGVAADAIEITRHLVHRGPTS